MGVEIDYFRAASDDEVATHLEEGPSSALYEAVVVEEPRRWWRGTRTRTEYVERPGPPTVDVVTVDGLFDPVVGLSSLLAVLGAGSYESFADHPDALTPVAEGDDVCVQRLRDAVRDALAVPEDRARVAAAAWAQAEEVCEAGPEEVEQVAVELTALACRARAAGESLYLWF